MMARETLCRASKLRAKQAITTIIEQENMALEETNTSSTDSTNTDSSPWTKRRPNENLIIRIPRTIWDAITPSSRKIILRLPTYNNYTSSGSDEEWTPSSQKLRIKLPSALLKTSKHGKKTSELPESPESPHSDGLDYCKVKIWRFHHGGRKRAIKRGKYWRKVVLEQPCLQSTCANCRQWHPHLIYEPSPLSWPVESGSVKHEGNGSPVIGLAPASSKEIQSPNVSSEVDSFAQQSDVLPLKNDIPLISPEEYPAHLTRETNNSTLGVVGFGIGGEDVGTGPGSISPKGILKIPGKRKWEGAWEDGDKQEQASAKKKVRFRHRVKFVFRSERGKERFRRLVEVG